MTSAPVLLWRRLPAEFLGSAFLATVVIGSGIAADIIVPHNGDAGRAPARAVHDGAPPSADRPPDPVQSL